jgi:hypothetical protein
MIDFEDILGHRVLVCPLHINVPQSALRIRVKVSFCMVPSSYILFHLALRAPPRKPLLEKKIVQHAH